MLDRSLISSWASAHVRYRRSAAASAGVLVTRGISVVSMIYLVPLVLDHLGPTQYGLWATVTGLTTFVAFADFGLGNGLMTALAEADGRDDRAGARVVVSTTTFALVGLAVGLGLIAWPLVLAVDWSDLLDVPATVPSADVRLSVIALLVSALIALPLGVTQKVHFGFQEGAANAKWQGLGYLLTVAGVVAAIEFEAGIALTVFAAVIGPVAALALQAVRMWRTHPFVRPSLSLTHSRALKELAHLGSAFFVLQTVMALAVASDNLILSTQLGVAAVTDYSILAQPFLWISGLASAILYPLWPAIGEAVSSGDIAWTRNVVRRSTASVVGLVFLLGGTLMLARDRIYGLWVGEAVDVDPSLILGFWAWTTCTAWGSALSIPLNAVKKLRFQLITATTMGLLVIVAKVVGARSYGPHGVVWGTVAVYATVSLIPTAWYVRRWLRQLSDRGEDDAEKAGGSQRL